MTLALDSVSALAKDGALDLQANLDDYFRHALRCVLRAQQLQLSATCESYVATLLQQQACPRSGASDERPFTLRLSSAQSLPSAAERFEGLRQLGDDVLYQLGFFGERFEARGVSPSYLIALGQSAYRHAGALLVRPSGSLEAAAHEPLDLFAELAEQFAALVDALCSLAEQSAAAAANSAQSVVQLYERWLRTRSPALAEELARRGFLAQDATEGRVA